MEFNQPELGSESVIGAILSSNFFLSKVFIQVKWLENVLKVYFFII